MSDRSPATSALPADAHGLAGDSARFPPYADVVRMEREAFASLDFRNPRIDEAAVKEAVTEFLDVCGAARRRQFRWFADVSSAREHIDPYKTVRAYWPLGAVNGALPLDAAWRAGISGFGWHHSPWSTSLHSADDFYFGEMLDYGRVWRYMTSGRLPRRSSQETACAAAAAPMLKAFVAGLFYLHIDREVVCVPRPSLWMAGGRLHREEGPALEWPTGECRYFWNGVHVPEFVVERPHEITPLEIRLEDNAERRRCMMERYGVARFLREVDAELVGEDDCGRLWRWVDLDAEDCCVLEVENGTREPDGTRRRYFLPVPPLMRSPRQAAAWTYGLSAEEYDVAVRT